MASLSSTPIELIFPQEGESWSALIVRMRQVPGELLLLLSGRETELIEHPDARKQLMEELRALQSRLRIATKHPTIAAEARAAGLRVFDRTKQLRVFLTGHPKANDALRVFSPHLWRQQLKSQMQRMGLLSMPKLRIFSLVGLSVILFGIVIFKLLPSAEVKVKPRQEVVSQTVNIFLVQSGATSAAISNRVRHMELIPLRIRFNKSLTFDHISKQFIGASAKLSLTVINKANEAYPIRNGTRFTNQAGMVFRITEAAIVEPGEEVTVPAVADDTDLYGQIIGDRGNVPAGLRWDIPGLAPEERVLVYAENRTAGAGGTTNYRTVLQEEDLDLARKRLEQELLVAAKQMAEEERDLRNQEHPGQHLVTLNPGQYPELTLLTYADFSLPTEFVGTEVTSVPVSGSIMYTVFAYDAQAILDTLRAELRSHVREGRRLLDEHLDYEHLVAHVIDYEDDLSWIKLTVDLTATEEYILDPLSPTGAIFGKKLREQIAGTKRDEAIRIIRNMPEVESVGISQWPPWSGKIPSILSHISIVSY